MRIFTHSLLFHPYKKRTQAVLISIWPWYEVVWCLKFASMYANPTSNNRKVVRKIKIYLSKSDLFFDSFSTASTGSRHMLQVYVCGEYAL